MRLFLPILVILFGLTIGFSTNYAFAELDANNAYVLEGSGFAVTESTIKTSQIDFALTTGNIANGRGGISIEDGFVTLNNDDFIVDNISGTILRDGKFLRISGTAEDSSGDDVQVRVFGRLIEDSAEGSVYSFTGRLTENNIEYKILYTSKISGFSEIISTPSTPTSSTSSDDIVVHILEGSSNPGFGVDYIGGSSLGSEFTAIQGDQATRARYFSMDRITVEPGDSITIVNNDIVSHTVVSGSGSSATSRGAFVLCAESEEELPEGFSYTQSNCSFTMDGRINTGEILPGESIVIEFEDIGFYRLTDPNYPWMRITAYSFNDVGSLILGDGEGLN